MSTRDQQLIDVIDRYMNEVNLQPTSMDEVADWGLRKGLFRPDPLDVRKMFRDALATAARKEKRYDGKRWYRAKHSVRHNNSGMQMSLWADIDKNATRSFMEKSIGQRRRNVVGDCLQLKRDLDHFNEINPAQEPI